MSQAGNQYTMTGARNCNALISATDVSGALAGSASHNNVIKAQDGLIEQFPTNRMSSKSLALTICPLPFAPYHLLRLASIAKRDPIQILPDCQKKVSNNRTNTSSWFLFLAAWADSRLVVSTLLWNFVKNLYTENRSPCNQLSAFVLSMATALLVSSCSTNSPSIPVGLTDAFNAATQSSQSGVGQISNPDAEENTDLNSAGPTDETETSDTDAALPSVEGETSTHTENNIDATGSDQAVSCQASDAHLQQRTLQLINEARSQPRTCGAVSFGATTSLSWSARLLQAAVKHSTDMAQHNFFDHTGSDGSSISMRVTDTGYDWRTVGENIAAGQKSASEAVTGWLNSPGHCKNLMNPNFTEFAVTCVEDSHTDYKQYWTNVLATPR